MLGVSEGTVSKWKKGTRGNGQGMSADHSAAMFRCFGGWLEWTVYPGHPLLAAYVAAARELQRCSSQVRSGGRDTQITECHYLFVHELLDCIFRDNEQLGAVIGREPWKSEQLYHLLTHVLNEPVRIESAAVLQTAKLLSTVCPKLAAETIHGQLSAMYWPERVAEWGVAIVLSRQIVLGRVT
jgi:hypothetical protein